MEHCYPFVQDVLDCLERFFFPFTPCPSFLFSSFFFMSTESNVFNVSLKDKPCCFEFPYKIWYCRYLLHIFHTSIHVAKIPRSICTMFVHIWLIWLPPSFCSPKQCCNKHPYICPPISMFLLVMYSGVGCLGYNMYCV